MTRFIEEADRGQSTLLPECLDDFIDESNPVRVIDVFVEALDLAEMSFDGVEPAATGRPSYHPSVLLKLYIYGYLNRVQSSWRLEREAGRNVDRKHDRECRHRRQQVQGREQPGQELHTGEGRAAARSAGGKRCAVSKPTRYGRPAGADGGAGREG